AARCGGSGRRGLHSWVLLPHSLGGVIRAPGTDSCEAGRNRGVKARAAKLPYAGVNRIRFEGSVSTAGKRGTPASECIESRGRPADQYGTGLTQCTNPAIAVAMHAAAAIATTTTTTRQPRVRTRVSI